MSTTKEFHDYVLEQLARADEVRTRKMMGEYLLYYRNKLVGDLCDNVLLVKLTPGSERLLPGAVRQYPYEGSRTLMLAVEDMEDTERMHALLETLWAELPEKKKT